MKKKKFEYLTEPELKAVLTECAFAIERAFEKHGIGDVITAMRECADRLERKEELSRIRKTCRGSRFKREP